jgi:hypothetical protein
LIARQRGGVQHALATLTDEQRRSWETGGFLHLKGALSRADVDAVRAIVDAQWANPKDNDHAVDILSGPLGGRAITLADAPPAVRGEAYKLNNLFGRIAEVRRIALSPSLRPILDALIGGEVLICNSLNFERGSQQAFHIDSWYMPGPDEGPMIAASFALDDVDADNGPIAYYPGSHLIPPFRFSDGRLNERPEEAPACRAYLDAEIAARGLEPVELHASAGDVFVWHGQLLHGGRPIRDFARERASLVVHYWRREDLPAESVRADAHGAYLGHTLRGEIRF